MSGGYPLETRPYGTPGELVESALVERPEPVTERELLRQLIRDLLDAALGAYDGHGETNKALIIQDARCPCRCWGRRVSSAAKFSSY